MDADFAQLTKGNLARYKLWKHCSFLWQSMVRGKFVLYST